MNEQVMSPEQIEEELKLQALVQMNMYYSMIPVDKRAPLSIEDYLKQANKVYGFIKGKQVRQKKSKTQQ